MTDEPDRGVESLKGLDESVAPRFPGGYMFPGESRGGAGRLRGNASAEDTRSLRLKSFLRSLDR